MLAFIVDISHIHLYFKLKMSNMYFFLLLAMNKVRLIWLYLFLGIILQKPGLRKAVTQLEIHLRALSLSLQSMWQCYGNLNVLPLQDLLLFSVGHSGLLQCMLWGDTWLHSGTDLAVPRSICLCILTITSRLALSQGQKHSFAECEGRA